MNLKYNVNRFFRALDIMFLIFLVLKICGVGVFAACSWWLVFAPVILELFLLTLIFGASHLGYIKVIIKE
jgi:hypothetical protein